MQLCYLASPRLSWFLQTQARGTATEPDLGIGWGQPSSHQCLANPMGHHQWLYPARKAYARSWRTGRRRQQTGYRIPFNALPIRWDSIGCDILQASELLLARARPCRLQGPTSLRPCAGACCSRTTIYCNCRLNKWHTMQYVTRARALCQHIGTLTAPSSLALASFPLSFSLSFSLACQRAAGDTRGGEGT